jgi:urease accessory protein
MTARAVWLALALIVSSFPATAHDAIAGGGPFVNGILHPIIEPAHLLSLLALGLWIGRQDRETLRRAIVAFAVALIAGLVAGSLATVPPSIPLGLAFILAGLAASGWRPPAATVAAMIAVAARFVIGLDSGTDDWAPAGGAWVGAMLIVLNVVNLAMRVTAPWLQIACRIAAAWIAAIALMLLAFSWRV